MTKIIIGVSVALLGLSAILGVLNTNKSTALRAAAARSETARTDSERVHTAREKDLKAKEAAALAKVNENQSKVAASEADVVKAQTEKSEFDAKLHANEAEIADLKQKLEGAVAQTVMPGAPPVAGAVDLQAQLTDLKQQLEAAEREKSLLTDKIRTSQDRSEQLEKEKKSRAAAAGNPTIRGTVLAVNQAYNFVVLNLGGRQGLQANAEMLVLRDGSLIGKIRISSVEPATAIGDIVSSSLGRGVQVQPGDTVIYAGTNS